MKYPTDSEGDVCAGVEVTYKGVKYTTGNRYHNMVELWKGNKFMFVVKFLKNHTFRRLKQHCTDKH